MLKRSYVLLLVGLCGLLDAIPGRWDGRWHRRGDWGCMIGLAHESARLDEKWKTGVWDE